MSTTPPTGPSGEQEPQEPAQQQPGQPYPTQQQPGQPDPAQQQPGQPYPGAAPYAPPPKGKRSRAAAVGITIASVVVAAVVAFGVRYAITSALEPSAEDQVQQGVAELKKNSELPKQIDSVTTLTDIQARGKDIRYVYEISDSVDPATLDARTLRQSVVSSACTMPATKKLLDDGIGMRYHYTFAGDGKTLDLAVGKSDC